MTDFSILDLREFISVAEQFDDRVRDFSTISLRLALQRISEEMKLQQFSAFLRLYEQSPALRYTVKQRLSAHPRELFRDAKAWQQVIEVNRSLLEDNLKKVLIIDNSFMADTATFYMMAEMLSINIAAKVEWVNSLGTQNYKRSLHLNIKELEMAQANADCLGYQVIESFRPEGTGYVYDFPSTCTPAPQKYDAIAMSDAEKYNFVISQNNSLVLNFAGQERYFKNCLSASSQSGRLFFGSRENFERSQIFLHLKQPLKPIRYYEKYAG